MKKRTFLGLFLILALALYGCNDIEGTVKDENCNPMSGVKVELTGGDGDTVNYWSTFTNGQGFYSFSGIESGTYTVKPANAAKGRTIKPELMGGAKSFNVKVKDANFPFDNIEQKGTVEHIVNLIQCQPEAGVVVTLKGEKLIRGVDINGEATEYGVEEVTKTATTDAAGQYKFTNLDYGDYQISCKYGTKTAKIRCPKPQDVDFGNCLF
ncbi:MAG: carboxypeptidase regulatory-like domain-containing protein [Desulfobacterales bacterium]|nr:carboxypeptidase regulatory-like domain-containing protein [Desulfobacterales bacterium]